MFVFHSDFTVFPPGILLSLGCVEYFSFRCDRPLDLTQSTHGRLLGTVGRTQQRTLRSPRCFIHGAQRTNLVSPLGSAVTLAKESFSSPLRLTKDILKKCLNRLRLKRETSFYLFLATNSCISTAISSGGDSRFLSRWLTLQRLFVPQLSTASAIFVPAGPPSRLDAPTGDLTCLHHGGAGGV